MDDSILDTIKKLLGLDPSYPAFDQDIIIHINSYLRVLNQIGVGKRGFTIRDRYSVWGQFLDGYTVPLDEVITWVYLRVKMVFDPPSSSLVAEAIKTNIDELTWRLNVEVDPECTFT